MAKPLRKYIIAVGGFDPSGGAGVLADVKTIEQQKLVGLSVLTANTIQTEDEFHHVEWVPTKTILEQLSALLDRYKISGIKVGLIESLDLLSQIVELVRTKYPKAMIIWDPVLSATSGFTFHSKFDQNALLSLIHELDYITPNLDEYSKLTNNQDENIVTKIKEGCRLIIKGGHSESEKGTDVLVFDSKEFKIKAKKLSEYEKHGTGCIFSSAFCSFLVKGYPPIKAVLKTKCYMERILDSNPTRLGYHKF